MFRSWRRIMEFYNLINKYTETEESLKSKLLKEAPLFLAKVEAKSWG